MTEEDIERPGAPPARSLLEGLTRNLRSGLRVACLLGTRRDGWEATWTQLALLIALSVASTLLWQIVDAGGRGQLSLSGLPDALFFVPVVLVAAWGMAAVARRAEATLALTVAILAAGLWIDAAAGIASLLLERAPRGSRAWLEWSVYLAYLAWFAVCAGVAGARMLGGSAGRRLAAFALALVVIGYPLLAVDRGDRLWTPLADTAASAAANPSYEDARSEDLLYLQPRLLERDLAALLPRRAGRPNLYLVSVAGYAEQDVFLREVESVDALFAERFGTRGRSLRLVNNRATMRDTPLATRTALAEALNRVGSVMDRDEDVLFLFLTSHGSPDGKFMLQFYPFRLQDLAAADLRTMLDQAGIRNRVIVVSSCYSGAFVDALRDDDTLVMTASAKDRNSFGCSNEADFTYFGKAFFDEALRAGDSFPEAFDRALPNIAARERKDEYTPSNPQRAMGANIGARLAALQEANARDRAAGTAGESAEKGLKPGK